MSEAIDALVVRIASRSRRPAPAPARLIEDAEKALGYELPPLLRALYLRCGNGGFFPGFLPLMLEDTSGEVPRLHPQARGRLADAREAA